MNYFYRLSPDKVLEAVESAGFVATGEFQQLNSYENRVFDVSLESEMACNGGLSNVICKFYRPGRWSSESILDEHQFLKELRDEQIAVAAPLDLHNSFNYNKTLHSIDGIWMAMFPKVRGRMPQEFLKKDLFKIGILLARMHNVGGARVAVHRSSLGHGALDPWETMEFLQDFIAPEVRDRYNDAAIEILQKFDQLVDESQFIRIHGDCHRGNILQMDNDFCLVDFDDFCNGPVIQDFWMLLSGDREWEAEEKEQLIAGYEEIREFPYHQWDWLPWLRGFRVIHYCGWIARRWNDPSFPRIFPEFNSFTYWAEETEVLEQISWRSSPVL